MEEPIDIGDFRLWKSTVGLMILIAAQSIVLEKMSSLTKSST